MTKVKSWQGMNTYLVPSSILNTAHMSPHSAGAFRIFSPPFMPLQSQGRRSVCLLTSSHCCTKPEGKPEIMPKVIAGQVGFKGWGRSEMEGRNRERTCDSLSEHYRKRALWRVLRCLYDRLWFEQVKRI